MYPVKESSVFIGAAKKRWRQLPTLFFEPSVQNRLGYLHFPMPILSQQGMTAWPLEKNPRDLTKRLKWSTHPSGWPRCFGSMRRATGDPTVSTSLEFWWFDSLHLQMCVRSTLSVLLCLACVLYQFYSDLSHAWFSLGLVWRRVTFDAFQAYCSCCPKNMFYLKMVVGRRTYKIRARLRASTFLRCLNCRKGASTKHSSTAVHIVLIVLFVLYESLLSSIIWWTWRTWPVFLGVSWRDVLPVQRLSRAGDGTVQKSIQTMRDGEKPNHFRTAIWLLTPFVEVKNQTASCCMIGLPCLPNGLHIKIRQTHRELGNFTMYDPRFQWTWKHGSRYQINVHANKSKWENANFGATVDSNQIPQQDQFA